MGDRPSRHRDTTIREHRDAGNMVAGGEQAIRPGDADAVAGRTSPLRALVRQRIGFACSTSPRTFPLFGFTRWT